MSSSSGLVKKVERFLGNYFLINDIKFYYGQKRALKENLGNINEEKYFELMEKLRSVFEDGITTRGSAIAMSLLGTGTLLYDLFRPAPLISEDSFWCAVFGFSAFSVEFLRYVLNKGMENNKREIKREIVGYINKKP